VVNLYTDVSGQPVGPFFKGQEVRFAITQKSADIIHHAAQGGNFKQLFIYKWHLLISTVAPCSSVLMLSKSYLFTN
jgi:hypothetical protein